MRLFKNLTVVGLALATLSGCADEGETQIVQFGRDMGIITMTGCSASSECEPGNVCVTGNCVPGSCHTDVACPDGMMCDTQLRTTSGIGMHQLCLQWSWIHSPCDANCYIWRC